MIRRLVLFVARSLIVSSSLLLVAAILVFYGAFRLIHLVAIDTRPPVRMDALYRIALALNDLIRGG